MPKLLLALVVVAVTLLGWWALRDEVRPPVAANEVKQVPAAAVTGPSAVDGADAPDRAVVPASARPMAAAAGRGGLAIAVLSGRVVEHDTQLPIAGAEVDLQFCAADAFWCLDPVYKERIEVLARASSDRDGRFHFDVADGRLHRLAVRAADHAPRTVPDVTAGAEVVIELSPGARVHGTVRCRGQVLPDMEVRLAVRGQGLELAQGRTDAAGAFAFAGLPAATCYLQVQSAQFQQKWEALEVVAGGDHEVTVEMEPGQALRGRVVDAVTSAPIAGAEVGDSWTFRRVARTDYAGSFELQGLRDGRFAPAYVRASGYASAQANLAGKLGEEVVFRLVRGGVVTGRIVDAAGAPLASAYAAVCASFQEAPGIGGSDWITAAVAADGRFQACGLRPDQHYWLMARGEGLGTRLYALPRVLAAGERLEVGDVVLRPGGGIGGRVVDEAGAPVAHLEVTVAGANDDSGTWLAAGGKPARAVQFDRRSLRTDEGGGFRTAGLAQGSYEVSVRPRGSQDSIRTAVAVVDGAITAGVRLVAPAGLTLTGSVTLPAGLTAAELAAAYLEAIPERGQPTRVHIAADGTFRFQGLRPGVVTLCAQNPPKGWSLAPRAGVTAGAADVQLAFEPSQWITGQVVDATGQPVQTWVWAQFEGMRPTLSAVADAEGRFRFEVPPGFRGTVGAGVPQRRVAGVVEGVLAGQGDVVVTLLP